MFSSTVVLCFCALFGSISGSAIPMWEFLSKQEKMSFLYSLFANQVESTCETSTLTNCNRQLLKYGLDKLKSMPEEYLDAMDPYQRGGSDIIWESMMAGHPMVRTTPKPRSTTTAKPNSYDDESFGDDFGSQASASAKIDNIYRVPPPKDFVLQIETGEPVYTYPDSLEPYDAYFTSERDEGFDKDKDVSSTEKTYNEVPLTGPMVVKVYPDGRPVKEDIPLPQDEDLRQYKMSKVPIPNF